MSRGSAFWASLTRYADLQSEVLPLYHDLVPQAHQVSYRTVSALVELSPRRLNPVTLIPALLELLTVATSLRTTLETTMPLGGIILEESESLLRAFAEYMPALRDYVPQVREVLPVVKELDPHYGDLAVSLDKLLEQLSLILPEIDAVLPVYIRGAPQLREFLRLVFDMGSDFSNSIDTTLERLSREAPRLLDFYDDADDFFPLLASNVISVLRRGGLPARLPSLRGYVPEFSELVSSTTRLMNNTRRLFPELLNTLVPLAAAVPRHPGVLETTSDVLIFSSVVGHQVNTTIMPTAMSMMQVIEPFVNALHAPVMNVIVVLPLMVSLIDGAVQTLPRVMAALPAASPLLRSLHRLSTQLAPAGQPLTQVLDFVAGLPDQTGDKLAAAAFACLPILPPLFNRPAMSPTQDAQHLR